MFVLPREKMRVIVLPREKMRVRTHISKIQNQNFWKFVKRSIHPNTVDVINTCVYDIMTQAITIFQIFSKFLTILHEISIFLKIFEFFETDLRGGFEDELEE